MNNIFEKIREQIIQVMKDAFNVKERTASCN